ncbi:MAG: DeoR/GlpR transcriptional regulator [Gammaproteobacteria bacterium]|nr:DeoR/GlpR transcriptional regulator [Gammaproteobacteria bacterium]
MIETIPIHHNNHREREILEELRHQGGSCRIQRLAECLNVSEETIRRNVKSLAKAGVVRKVHGGVHLSESHIEQPFNRRLTVNKEAKWEIAEKMADIINPGDTLFLDIGSTTAHIANSLVKHRDLFIVTNSITVAQTLATKNNNRVFLAGGELRAHDAGAFGQEALDFVSQFNAQYAVLSVAAINAEVGFMVQDVREAVFSRAIAARSRVTIVAADDEKFGKTAPIILDSPGSFEILVTNQAPPQEIQDMLQRNDIDLVLSH